VRGKGGTQAIQTSRRPAKYRNLLAAQWNAGVCEEQKAKQASLGHGEPAR